MYAEEPAISTGTNDSSVKQISSEADFKEFLNNDEYITGILTTNITVDCTEEGYLLKANKHLYGGGNTITISGNTVYNKSKKQNIKSSKLSISKSFQTVRNRHENPEDGNWYQDGTNIELVYDQSIKEYGYYVYTASESSWDRSVTRSKEITSLFSEIKANAVIENIKITTENGINSKDSAVGVLCGINNGTIKYVSVSTGEGNTVKSSGDVNDATGVICGINGNTGKIFSCTSEGTIDTSNNCIGSLCGKNYGEIERCSSSVSINYGSAKYVGGLCGYNKGTIYDCLFEGMLPITGEFDTNYYHGEEYVSENHDLLTHRNKYIGGLCGILDDGHIWNSLYNGKGDITITDTAENGLEYLHTDNGYDCVGQRNAETGNLANCFRIDTYNLCYEKEVTTDEIIGYEKKHISGHLESIPDFPWYKWVEAHDEDDISKPIYRTITENVKEPVIRNNHYHANRFPDNVDYGESNFTNGELETSVLNKLNSGYNQNRSEIVWKQGNLFPVLCVSSEMLRYDMPKANNTTYDGESHVLLKVPNPMITYGAGTVSSGNVKITKELDMDPAGRDVLVVEDIIDSGNTLNFLLDYFAEKKANSV